MRFRVSASSRPPLLLVERTRSGGLGWSIRNLLGPSEARTGTSNRVGGLVGPEVEAGRGDVHPGRVGRDNHRTDTDMLIPESFTRDI